MSNIDYNKHIWEGWTVRDFVDELEDPIDMIMCGEAIWPPFESAESMTEWICENQPYYKHRIPEVEQHFINLYFKER